MVELSQPKRVLSASPGETHGSLFYSERYSRQWAVVIGIDRYKTLQRLDYAVADAEGIAKILSEQFHFDEVKVLLNEDATRDAIRETLIDCLPDKTKKDDCVLFFYAGHGAKRRLPDQSQMGFLVPVDAVRGKWTTYVWMEELLRAGEMSAAKHLFYILDCCYSGLANWPRSTETSQLLRDVLTRRARQVLTAGMDNQEVEDRGPGGHSIFSYYLIEALSRKADGPVLASSLMSHVRTCVSKDSKSRQTPDFGLLSAYGHRGGDFVFMRPTTINSEPTPEVNLVDELRKAVKISDRRQSEDMIRQILGEDMIRQILERRGK